MLAGMSKGAKGQGRWPNRIRHFRERAGLTQDDLVEATGFSQSKISALELGQRKLSRPDALIIAAIEAMHCSAEELHENQAATVPLELIVAAFESEARPERWTPRPLRRVAASPLLARPEQCFAAHLVDDSFNELRPPDTMLYCRRVEGPEAAIKAGAPILVKRYRIDRADGEILEVLAGMLNVDLAGELTLRTCTTNRQISRHIEIQRRRRPGPWLAERRIEALARPAEVRYTSRPEDEAEIVGVIERSDDALPPSIAA